MPSDLGPLGRRLPDEEASDDVILMAFLDYVQELNLTLFPAQEQAILELYAGKNVILSTPTGSGKSLVALALHFRALTRGQRVYYTSPIKALASEKFFSLARTLCPDWVGMSTGDATVNRDALIVCCTAEVLANIGLAEGRAARVDAVVMDEFHYYSDKERGVSWQLPLLTLPQSQFLLMSATLGDTTFFENELRSLTKRETVTVRSEDRPVPLKFHYAKTPLHETIFGLLSSHKAPIYLVNFTQRAAEEEARHLLSLDICSKDEKKNIAEALRGFHFDSPYGKDLVRYLKHGIGVHHAGLLPKYRLQVEKLAQLGLLKVISGTDTLGVGINVPIRCVLFSKLCKFDGEKTAVLSVRDFKQISGRAGRKGFDDEGYVVAQAPAHVIENMRAETKAGDDPAKKRKIVKKKPPEWGYAHWDETLFTQLQTSPSEALTPRFQVSHGMLLSVLTRPEKNPGGCMEMARIISRSHGRRAEKKALGKTLFQMYRSLLQANILNIDTVLSLETTTGYKKIIQINAGLQQEFSLHHTLSLYLIDVLASLQESSQMYALDLLTMVESIVDNPESILQKQVDKKRNELFLKLKAEGVPFEDRQEKLDEVEYDKPQSEFVYSTFNKFAKSHPWVGSENIRPKSIARAMYEEFYSFSEYVKELGLFRSEGLLLRYLSQVVKVLEKTVPDFAKTPEVREMESYFLSMVYSVDSSLLDEWDDMRLRAEKLNNRGDLSFDELEKSFQLGAAAGRQVDLTANKNELRVFVRNHAFQIVRALSKQDFAGLEELSSGSWSMFQFKKTWTECSQNGDLPSIRIDRKARDSSLFQLEENHGMWRVTQNILPSPKNAKSSLDNLKVSGLGRDDDEGSEEDDTPCWFVRFQVDLEKTKVEGKLVIQFDTLEAYT